MWCTSGVDGVVVIVSLEQKGGTYMVMKTNGLYDHVFNWLACLINSYYL